MTKNSRFAFPDCRRHALGRIGSSLPSKGISIVLLGALLSGSVIPAVAIRVDTEWNPTLEQEWWNPVNWTMGPANNFAGFEFYAHFGDSEFRSPRIATIPSISPFPPFLDFDPYATEVEQIIFDADAGDYLLRIMPEGTLEINNAIVNNSGQLQKFRVGGDESDDEVSTLRLFGQSGDQIQYDLQHQAIFNVSGGSASLGDALVNLHQGTSVLRLENGASAGNSVITNHGGLVIFDGGTGTTGLDRATLANLGGFAILNGNVAGSDDFVLSLQGGIFDLSRIQQGELRIGELSGSGAIYGGSKKLIVDQSGDTTFSGVIGDGFFPLIGFSNPANSQGATLTKEGNGRLLLSSANTYTGNTIINGGTLATNHVSALGVFSGDPFSNGVQINNDSTLELLSNLTVQKLQWTDGNIRLNPLTTQLTVTDFFNFSGDQDGNFLIDGAGLNLGSYTLVNYGSTNFTNPSAFTAQLAGSSNPNVTFDYDFEINPNSLIFNLNGATATGPLLQNSTPINIPTFADFVVDGAHPEVVNSTVHTGAAGESNVINSLEFINGGILRVENQLTVTSGEIVSNDGERISGGDLTTPGNWNLFINDDEFSIFSNLHNDLVDPNGFGLDKAGEGVLMLSSSGSDYTGRTRVQQGALILNGDFSAVTGDLEVWNGAALSGNAPWGGNVLIQNGGILSPGDYPQDPGFGYETMRILGNLTFENAAEYYWQASGMGNPNPSSGKDSVVVGGDLTLDGLLNIEGPSEGMDMGAYRLFSYGGALNNQGMEFGEFFGVPASQGDHMVISTAVNGQVNLIVAGPDTPVQFWDGLVGPPASGTIEGGAGIWDNFSPYFTDPSGTAIQTWQNGIALFAGMGGFVGVQDEIHIQGLQFMADGYTLGQGANSDFGLVLDTPSGTGATITVDAGVSATIEAIMRGGEGFEKRGEGTLELTGINEYVGNTVLSNGWIVAHDDANFGDLGGEIVAHYGGLRFGTAFDLLHNIALSQDDEFDSLTLDSNVDSSISGRIYDAQPAVDGDGWESGFAVTGTGSVTLTNPDNDFEAVSVLDGATLIQGADNALADNAFYSVYGSLGQGTLDLNDFDLDAAALFVGAGGLVDLGSGHLTITGSGVKEEAFTNRDSEVYGEITGTGWLTKAGEGTAFLGSDNSYTGGTELAGGRLVTDALLALGSGDLELQSGVLNPQSQLKLGDDLWWLGDAAIEVVLGPNLLHVTDNLNNDGGAETGHYLLSHDGINPLQQRYVVTTFGGDTNFAATDFSAEFAHGIQNVAFEYGFDLEPGAVVFEFTRATAWGPILQNSAPVFTPTFADFIVQGAVRTGELDEDNIIRSLSFDPGSSLQVYNNLEVTTGEFTVNSGRATIRGGSLSVPGEFHKRGAGLLEIRSRVTVEGNSTIHAGSLAVNGVFQTPLLRVNPGATLMGSGVVDGSVVNVGTIAPGNSIGTLTITHDYTQTRSGTYQYEVASPGHHDFLVIGGTAKLNGTLEILPVNGYHPAYGDVLPILAAEKIDGRFTQIEVPRPQDNRARFFTLDQLTERRRDQGLGLVTIAPTSYTLVAETPNQENLAAALDQWIGIEPENDQDISRVTLALDLLPEEAYPPVFEQLLPHPQAVALELASSIGQRQNRDLDSLLSARRLGRRAVQEASTTRIAGVVDVPMNSAKSAKSASSAVASTPPAPAYRWNAWAQGGGSLSDSVLLRDVDGDFDSWGLLAGVDRAINEQLAVGLLFGYNQAEADFGRGTRLDLDSLTFGGYATLDLGALYLNAALSGGPTDAEVSRRITLPGLEDRQARSDLDGHSLSAFLSGGYDFQAGSWTHGPTAALAWSRTELEGRERGADALGLALRDATGESLQSRLGYRVAYTAQVNENLAIIPQLSAAWEHEYLDPATLEARLHGGDGPAFRYEGAERDRDRLLLGAGLGFQIGEQLYTHLGYQAQLGEETIHSATLGVNVSF